MCIEFVCINNTPANGGYKLIVTNNRDELYARPTIPAAFWGDQDGYLSGRDNEVGREGGTWFGVSKEGKFAGLLNILTTTGPLPDKRPRGHLITDYLKRSVSAVTYLSELAADAQTYNMFNLVLIERSAEDGGDWAAHYFSNATEFKDRSTIVLKDGVHGFSNSVYEKPFQKVLRGQAKFADIVSRFPLTSNRDNLYNALFDLMADNTCTLPDAQLMEQGGDRLAGPLGQQRSGIYVNSAQIGYGTRTTTILTVNADDEVEYTEKTMREPINPTQPIWDTVCYKFKLLPVNPCD